ncbi:MAG TPA: NADH:flavin oxidoreductase [Methanosarcinaceae archaeon]|nr:NADH:flavin oxidoreductase [Methanosarcinaceae archaeon]
MIFDPIIIGTLNVHNRFVRSATHEWLADDDGRPTPAIGDIYEELARNDVGLIITGYSYVNPRGRSSDNQQGIYDDSFIEPYREIISRVHNYKSKIIAQVVHGGRQAAPTSQYPVPLAPSAVTDTSSGITPIEMTEADILETIEDFANAVRRAKEAGFDGVQLHCAHGFLLSNFISPYTNQRNDRWGGSVGKRTQVIVDIIKRTRQMVGDDFPIMVKLNATDGFGFDGKSGKVELDAPECIEIAKILEQNSICAIEVSGGITEAGEVMARSGIDKPEKEAYFRHYSKMIKEAVNIPIILVGGVRSKPMMESLVSDGYADMISICRPLIREPDLIIKLKSGESEQASCVSCNRCFDPSGVKCNCP